MPEARTIHRGTQSQRRPLYDDALATLTEYVRHKTSDYQDPEVASLVWWAIETKNSPVHLGRAYKTGLPVSGNLKRHSIARRGFHPPRINHFTPCFMGSRRSSTHFSKI